MAKKRAAETVERSPTKVRKMKTSSSPSKMKAKSKARKRSLKKKAKTSSDNQPTVFRCNLQPIVKLLEKQRDHIPQTHIEAIMRTPFGVFFNAIYENKIDIKSIDRISKPIMRIMGLYSLKKDGFVMGDKLIQLTADDVALTFGIPKVGNEVVLYPKTMVKATESKFIERHFKDMKIIKKDAIVSALNNTLKEEGKEAAEDSARLIILHMVVTIFLASSQGAVGWSFISHIEDFDNIRNIAWAKVFYNHLMQNIKKYYNKPFKTPGCVLQILVVEDLADVSETEQKLLTEEFKEVKEQKLPTEEAYLPTEQKLPENNESKMVESLKQENERLRQENKELLERVIQLETLMQVKSDGSVAWENSETHLHITTNLLEDLLCNGFVDTRTFVRDGNQKNAMKFLNDTINEVDATTNLLLFPMNTAKDKKDKQRFHWTFLVLDLRTRTWLHYNTMPLRGKKKNIFLKDAKQMARKQAVTDILNMQLLYRGMTVLEDHTKIISKECPRQGFSRTYHTSNLFVGAYNDLFLITDNIHFKQAMINLRPSFTNTFLELGK
ncbi:hypothetical protein LguiB_032258 [Lonicera macranthoides]